MELANWFRNVDIEVCKREEDMRLDDVIHHACIVGPLFLNVMVVCWEGDSFLQRD